MNEYCPGVRRVCISPEKCCLSGTVCCVPTSLYSLNNDHLNKRLVIEHDIRFSVINLWYFWFAIVFFVTTCSGVCAFWRRQRRMLLQAAERSAAMRLQLNHCSQRVQLSPTLAGRELGHRQLGQRPVVGRRQLGERQRSRHAASSVLVDSGLSYFATVVPIGYLDEETGVLCSPQFPDPPLYSEVVTDKDSEFTHTSDDIPPSYAEASRYTNVAAAAAASTCDDGETMHVSSSSSREDNAVDDWSQQLLANSHQPHVMSDNDNEHADSTTNAALS